MFRVVKWWETDKLNFFFKFKFFGSFGVFSSKDLSLYLKFMNLCHSMIIFIHTWSKAVFQIISEKTRFYIKTPKKSEKTKKWKKNFLYLSSKYDRIMKTSEFSPIFRWTDLHTILNKTVDGIVRKINIIILIFDDFGKKFDFPLNLGIFEGNLWIFKIVGSWQTQKIFFFK